ncbi:MAG: UTP--glucose-1-phosphate uridylyltransferase [Patescibacteria group bacterium]
MKVLRKAVLPVAGLGTRTLPATKAIPKELLPIVDTPVLQLLVEELVKAGIAEIIFVVAPSDSAIQKHFSPDPALEKVLRKKGQIDLAKKIKKISELAKFTYVKQHEALGDGHAVYQARKSIGDEPFLVVFGDDLIVSKVSATTQLLKTWAEKHSAVVGLQEVLPEEVSRYGIVKPKGDSLEIESFIEKPQPGKAPSNLAIVGKYICPPEIFPILEKHPNASGEIRLIDALSELVKSQPVHGCVLTGERFDCGAKLGWLKANIEFALQHPETSEAIQSYLREIVPRLKRD